MTFTYKGETFRIHFHHWKTWKKTVKRTVFRDVSITRWKYGTTCTLFVSRSTTKTPEGKTVNNWEPIATYTGVCREKHGDVPNRRIGRTAAFGKMLEQLKDLDEGLVQAAQQGYKDYIAKARQTSLLNREHRSQERGNIVSSS